MSDDLSPAQFAVLVGQLDILCGKLERVPMHELASIDIHEALIPFRLKLQRNMEWFCAATVHDRSRAVSAIGRTAALVNKWTEFRKSQEFGERLKATRHHKYVSVKGFVKQVGNVTHVNFRGH